MGDLVTRGVTGWGLGRGALGRLGPTRPGALGDGGPGAGMRAWNSRGDTAGERSRRSPCRLWMRPARRLGGAGLPGIGSAAGAKVGRSSTRRRQPAVAMVRHEAGCHPSRAPDAAFTRPRACRVQSKLRSSASWSTRASTRCMLKPRSTPCRRRGSVMVVFMSPSVRVTRSGARAAKAGFRNRVMILIITTFQTSSFPAMPLNF